MDNEIVKRLMWTGLVAGTGALASVVAMRISALIWQRVFGEDPPESEHESRSAAARRS